MSRLRQAYLEKYLGSPTLAAAGLARDLSRGDPSELKAGYTVPNAIITARELFPEAPEHLIRKLNGWNEEDE